MLWREGFELEREVEAARAHELLQRLEAGGNRVPLPARDLRSITRDSRAKVSLGDAGAQARVSDQVTALHGVSLVPLIEFVLRTIYVPHVFIDPLASPVSLPTLLGVDEVRARYRLRSAQAARRVMREAGARSVSGRLFVPLATLAAWESSRTVAPPRRRGAATPPAAATTALRGLEAGWWRGAS